MKKLILSALLILACEQPVPLSIPSSCYWLHKAADRIHEDDWAMSPEARFYYESYKSARAEELGFSINLDCGPL